jgi:hypothetical protein
MPRPQAKTAASPDSKTKWRRGSGKARETPVGLNAADEYRQGLAQRVRAFVDRTGLDDSAIARKCNLPEPVVRGVRIGAVTVMDAERERIERLLAS